MGIRKWIGCVGMVKGKLSGFCSSVPEDLKEVFIKAIASTKLTLSGSYRAYAVVKLGWTKLELVSLKGGDEVITVDVHRVILFDGKYADHLQQVLKDGTGMEGATKVVPMYVARHPQVGMTISSCPKVLLKLKPDPFGLHA